MKKFLLQIIGFGLFSSIFYALALFIWGTTVSMSHSPNLQYIPKGYGHMNSRMAEVKNTKDIDLLFIGSSHAYRGFDNRIFKEKGYSSFNLGSSSQTPVQTQTLLAKYLKQLNPDHVIYEVYPELFQSDGVESSLDLISNDQTDLHTVSMALQVNHLKTYNTLIYAILNHQLMGMEANEPLRKGNDSYISGGYVEKEFNTFVAPSEKKEKVTITHKQFQVEAFEDIVQTIKESGIKLTIVFTPITSYHYASYDDINKFDSLITSYNNINYYDFNTSMNLNDSLYFYDSHHMNQRGVERFNRRLIDELNL